MDKFVKKWQSNSNVANTTQQQSPANEEEQTPIDSRAALERVLINSNARSRPATEKEEVDTSNLTPDPANCIPIIEYNAKVT